MKVKVYCPCGSKFEFEVEPVNERMPVALSCPVCGADATGLANEVIKQQLAAASPAAPLIPPAPRSGGGLRIARATPAPPAAPTPDPVTSGEGEETPEPAPAPRTMPQRAMAGAAPTRQKYLHQEEMRPAIRYAIIGVVCALALTAAGWVWYKWFAREPKIVYSLDFPKSEDAGMAMLRPDVFYQLIGPDRLLSVKSQHVTLMDPAANNTIWTVPIPSGVEAFAMPHVVATSNDVWVAWPNQLMRLDRQTGTQKAVSVPDPVISVNVGEDMILVVSGNPSGKETVTQFSLPEGNSQTADITIPAPPAIKAPPAVTRPTTAPGHIEEENQGTRDSAVSAIARATTLMGGGNRAAADALPNGADAGDDKPYEELAWGPQTVFDAGANAVWFRSKVVEFKQMTVQAMHKASGKSVLDNPNLNASQGIDLAEEMANNAQRDRTGGVDIVDVSRYQVTLHRMFAADVPDWTGEIIGPPGFVPMKTVDLVVAGTNLVAFDKSNKKLWDAKLTYPVSAEFRWSDHPPCLETKDGLYFADKGMLTRFDPATGNVRWRLTSVGISAIQADGRGALYIETTTLRPDVIQYSQQINLRDKDKRVVMKVEAATGKTIWSSEFPGAYFHCVLSGKFLYTARVWQTQAMLKLDEGPDVHSDFNLLDAADGKTIWSHYMPGKVLLKAEAQQNWILLQFPDQVRVLKFFTL